MNIFWFVFVEHFFTACLAALLFFGGILLAYLVVKQKIKFLSWLPRQVFELVRKLIGPHPGLVRLGLVIFCFNGLAICLYMASGFHPVLPATISILTGFNIMMICLMIGDELKSSDLIMSTTSSWAPGPGVSFFCGMAVLILELPCFWYSIAMGISLGREIVSGQVAYGQGLALRLQAYTIVILPTLMLSAICETVAIQGMLTAPREA